MSLGGGRLWRVAGAGEDGERGIFGEAMIGLGELAEQKGGTFGGRDEAGVEAVGTKSGWRSGS
jgi:hypothetical protein